MKTKEIIESGFVKAFIAEYFEDKIHSFYPDKDKLLYVLCSTDLEKQQVAAKQIEVIKSEIQKLGNEDLSFAYLLSCKPKSISGHNYIEPDKRFDFWLNRFCEVFIDSINTFTPIIEACNLFESKISNEDFENEFWEMYPASQKPKENYLPFVIQRESELLNEIEYTISEYKENEYWEFDFEEYQKFIDTSKQIELLFNVSELLVQLHRLEMFNELLLPPQQTETKTKQEIPKTFEELFYKAEHAEPCLKILSELQPPVIDAINNYIGKAKGVFPLWVKVLKNHKPEPLIKHFKDAVYKDLLNQKVKGLNLSKDASEFRKQYKRVENDKIELDIKTILSQYSQSGKLGK